MAHAEPVAPQPNMACAPELSGALTRLPGEAAVLKCTGGMWRTYEDPYPQSDRWLTYGPTLTLHGEGQRNRELDSGEWTAYPLSISGQCTAQQMSVAEAGGLTGPDVSTSRPGEPMRLTLRPLLFNLELGGSCLWVKG
jgi:hypothetical protein